MQWWLRREWDTDSQHSLGQHCNMDDIITISIHQSIVSEQKSWGTDANQSLNQSEPLVVLSYLNSKTNRILPSLMGTVWGGPFSVTKQGPYKDMLGWIWGRRTTTERMETMANIADITNWMNCSKWHLLFYGYHYLIDGQTHKCWIPVLVLNLKLWYWIWFIVEQ